MGQDFLNSTFPITLLLGHFICYFQSFSISYKLIPEDNVLLFVSIFGHQYYEMQLQMHALVFTFQMNSNRYHKTVICLNTSLF